MKSKSQSQLLVPRVARHYSCRLQAGAEKLHLHELSVSSASLAAPYSYKLPRLDYLQTVAALVREGTIYTARSLPEENAKSTPMSDDVLSILTACTLGTGSNVYLRPARTWQQNTLQGTP